MKMEFESMKGKKGLSAQENEELKNLFEKLDEIEVPEPSVKMKQRFYQKIDDYKLKKSVFSRFRLRLPALEVLFGTGSPVLRPAFVVIIFLLGTISGLVINGNRKESVQLVSELQNSQKTLMLTLLEQPSATSRLKAVNLTNEFDKPDQIVIDALFTTLNNDENTNVRMAALEALFRYSKLPEVRQGLIESISNQDSPMILVTLSKAMVLLQEKESVEEFKKLLDNETLDEKAKNKINDNIQKII
jgi:hypothetical protein